MRADRPQSCISKTFSWSSTPGLASGEAKTESPGRQTKHRQRKQETKKILSGKKVIGQHPTFYPLRIRTDIEWRRRWGSVEKTENTALGRNRNLQV